MPLGSGLNEIRQRSWHGASEFGIFAREGRTRGREHSRVSPPARWCRCTSRLARAPLKDLPQLDAELAAAAIPIRPAVEFGSPAAPPARHSQHVDLGTVS